MMEDLFSCTVFVSMYTSSLFSLFMRAYTQAMNEYRGGEMAIEVVVDRNLWTETMDRSWK